MSNGGPGFRVALVTGMSGAGRSTAARALEDTGWFVIDNLPPALITQAIELARANAQIDRLAVVVDARGRAFFSALAEVMGVLPSLDVDVRTLFLEASDEALVRRFESSRRPHPLQGHQRIIDGLVAERELLGGIRAQADVVIDTTNLNVHDLRRKVEAAFPDDQSAQVHATVMSFGFKYGIPVDADVVGDARFLPNPHWDESMRDRTGQDAQVSAFVLGQAGADAFLDTFASLVLLTADGYVTEGKRYVTVAIGCTGGKHRSVALAEALGARLQAAGIPTLTFHRDLGRE